MKRVQHLPRKALKMSRSNLKCIPRLKLDFQTTQGDLFMKTRFIEEQIIKVFKRHEAGAKVDKLWRDLSISTGRF